MRNLTLLGTLSYKNPPPSVTAVQQLLAFQPYHLHSGQCDIDNVNLMPLSTIVKQNLLSCDLLTMLLPNAEEDVDLSIPSKKIEVYIWAPFFSVAPFPLDS